MRVLVFDTATPSTVVGAVGEDGRLVERRHDPAPGERPGHVEQLLGLAWEALEQAGLGWADVERIGVGVGPGSFTGLRIGVATGRALAQATGAEVAPVSTLGALAAGAGDRDGPVLALLDARRGEAFVAAFRGDQQVTATRAVAPEGLAGAVREAGESPLAVGDGAVKFRAQLEAAGATVPEDGAVLHVVGAAGLHQLAIRATPVDRHALVPEYVRLPDARPRTEQ